MDLEHEHPKWSHRVKAVWKWVFEASAVIQTLAWLGVASGTVLAIAVAAWAYIGGAQWPVVATIVIVLFLTSMVVLHYFLSQHMKSLPAASAGYHSTFTMDEHTGILDFLLEGDRRVRHGTKLIKKVNGEMRKVGRKANAATFWMTYSKSPDKQMKKIQEIVKAISSHIESIEETTSYFEESTPVIKICYMEVIDRMDISNSVSKKDLNNFVNNMSALYISSISTADIIASFAGAYEKIKGISGHLNRAADAAIPKVLLFSEKVKDFGAMCDVVAQVGHEKLKGRSGAPAA